MCAVSLWLIKKTYILKCSCACSAGFDVSSMMAGSPFDDMGGPSVHSVYALVLLEMQHESKRFKGRVLLNI